MIKADEDLFICDMAETYRIYDYRQLPLNRVAIFAYGLRDDSRSKMLLNHQKVTLENVLLASAVDRLSFLMWSKTKDGQRGTNKPKSVVDVLLAKNRETDQLAFHDGKEFEKERNRLLNTIGGED
ncbi:hypothetical protein KG090_00625 [Carnobacteriaceae bacterium zg-ZUI240]|nr:hypothetical protein [Carnobacteriaceae bacterium zg-ZUI240]